MHSRDVFMKRSQIRNIELMKTKKNHNFKGNENLFKSLCKKFSPAGNRTRVFHVTGGDTHHYTTEECNFMFKFSPNTIKRLRDQYEYSNR